MQIFSQLDLEHLNEILKIKTELPLLVQRNIGNHSITLDSALSSYQLNDHEIKLSNSSLCKVTIGLLIT